MFTSKKFKIFLTVLLILSALFLVYVFFLQDYFTGQQEELRPELDEIHVVGDIPLTSKSNMWALGRYEGQDFVVTEGQEFVIKEGRSSLTVNAVFLDDEKEISTGDYLLMHGDYNISDFTFNASSIEVLDENGYYEVLREILPVAYLDIDESNLTLQTGCEGFTLDVEVRNAGKEPIHYENIGSSNKTLYTFIFTVNDEIVSFYSDDAISTEDFTTIEPDESVNLSFSFDEEFTYKAFCESGFENEIADFRIDFGNIRERDSIMEIGKGYNFLSVFDSNEIGIRVMSCNCQ